MAAAALLRSMARKLARAPQPLRGLHGGARSGPGGTLPPPTSNQIHQVSGDRSGAALPSLSTKIARTPLQPHQRRILNRGYSSTTAPQTGDKDKIIEDLRRRLWWSRVSAGMGGFMLTAICIHGYFWLLPEVEKERERLQALNKLMGEDEHPSVSLAQILARKGYRKQQLNAATEKETMIDKLPEDWMEVCLDMLKETLANLEEAQADLKEYRTARERIVKQKEGCSFKAEEGCSRVG